MANDFSSFCDKGSKNLMDRVVHLEEQLAKLSKVGRWQRCDMNACFTSTGQMHNDGNSNLPSKQNWHSDMAANVPASKVFLGRSLRTNKAPSRPRSTSLQSNLIAASLVIDPTAAGSPS